MLSLTQLALSASLASLLLLAGCDKPGGDGYSSSGSPTTSSSGGSSGGNGAKPRVAYVTNGVDPFWVIAEKGARDAAREFDADVNVIMPASAEDQKQKIEDAMVRGVDGIAISPIDATNQTSFINEVAAKARVITHDSDAPQSKRLLYIGMDNYMAGRMCGQLMKEARPKGGKIAIFVGRLEQDNARLRRAGVMDELLGRERDDTRIDDPGKSVTAGAFTIIGTWTDQFDRAKAKNNAEDVLTAHPDLAGAIGLFAYNPPLCLEALRSTNSLGKVAVVGFDEQDGTLQAIRDGHCHGTVVQNPYMYGKESVRVLAALTRGDGSVLASGKFMDIPARQIRKDNVDEFWADLKVKTKE